MNFNEMSGDSESQTESAMLPRRRAVLLAKSIKHERQKLGA